MRGSLKTVLYSFFFSLFFFLNEAGVGSRATEFIQYRKAVQGNVYFVLYTDLVHTGHQGTLALCRPTLGRLSVTAAVYYVRPVDATLCAIVYFLCPAVSMFLYVCDMGA